MSKALKWIFWGFTGSIILCALIFYQALLTFLATWSLQAYSISKWGAPLQYESISFDGNQLTLIKPLLERDFSFNANQLHIYINPIFWKRQLHVKIDIEQPHWHLSSNEPTQWEEWKKLHTQNETWIKIIPDVCIHEGWLTWKNQQSKNENQFQFDLTMNSHTGGNAKFYFDSSDASTNFLLLQAKKNDQGIKVECHFENLHCTPVFEIAQLLKFDASPYKISSGSLQGQVTAVFPSLHRPYLEGHLTAEDFTFSKDGGLIGQIEKAHLQLEKNPNIESLIDPLSSTIWKLEFLNPASILYHSSIQEWSIHHILGTIQLNDAEAALIDLQAHCGTEFTSEWNLHGEANLNSQSSLNINALLSCSGFYKDEGKIHLTIQDAGEKSRRATLQCDRLSYYDFNFIQTLMTPHWPILKQVSFQNGECNARVEAEIKPEGLGDVDVKYFEAFQLQAKFAPLNINCHLDQAKGHGSIQLGKENFWHTLNAEFFAEGGEIEFDEFNSLLPIEKIQSHLLIQNGRVEHSLITLQIAGLKGKMDIEWGDNKELLTFKLDGRIEDIADLLPKRFQDNLKSHFFENKLLILANLKRQNRQIELDGTIHIQRAAHLNEMDFIHFACELKKIKNSSNVQYVPVGWFHAQKLPLEKFLSPFIFRDGVLLMSGEGEFKGSFDDQFLEIKYEAHDLKLENDNLCINIPFIRSPIPGQLMGWHRINLSDSSFQGNFPIQGGTYFEKNTGLIFQDIQGNVFLKNDFIHMLPIEAYCQGVFFSGNVELDYHDPTPGVFDLNICCPTLSGKVSQIQNLMAHLEEPSLLHKIPLEGDITGKEKGLQLKFAFQTDDYQLDANIQGLLTGGSLPFEESDMAFKEIYLDIDYRHQGRLLEFGDIQGTLLVGKPRRVEEFLLTGNQIRFHYTEQPDIEFDVGIYDRDHELLRLKGYTEDTPEGVKSLHLDNRSHFSCIYPQLWQCCLKDWSNISQFEFRSQFDLQKFLQDLQCFRHSGFLFLSHRVIDKISQFLPVEGKGCLSLQYQPDQSYTYQLEGFNIKQENSNEHYALLKGSKHDKKWMIDQLQWDDWNVSAELHQLPEKWKIPFLGLKAGQTLLLGLEGEWLQEQAHLQAKLKYCEVDLAQLDFFEPMHAFVTKWWPKGTLNATGEIEWDLLALNPLEGFKISLFANVHHLSLRDYPIFISSPFSLKLQPNDHFSLENVQIELSPQSKQAYIDLKKFEYDSLNETMRSLEALFQVPHYELDLIGESLNHHFSDYFDASFKDLFVSSKKQGLLKGNLSMGFLNTHEKFFRLELDDGLYVIKNKEFDLKQFQMQMAGNELQFSALSQLERCCFQIAGKTTWPSCEQGQCKLLSLNSTQPLIVDWEKKQETGFKIKSLQGEFSGCSFLLRENKEFKGDQEWIPLQGQVKVDFNRLSPLLAPDIAEVIETLKLGSFFSFGGNFWLNPQSGASFLDTVSFKGKLESEEFILKGYQMQNLQADLQYVPDQLDMQNLLIKDTAGTIKLDHCIVLKNKFFNSWSFIIPELTVKNLKPYLLRDTEINGQKNPKFRSLILKRIDLQDVQGELAQIHTWQGQGSLHFMNPTKKNPLQTLLAIPAEIILRLGLDPHVLNPVTGFVYFDLKGDRFYLNRFRDVYSEGRGSKFYLAQGLDPHWMDWNGNLSLNIRMKQYNLLFKIAELFTVSIQGNIKKPQYRLQKQQKTSHKMRTVPHFADSFALEK